MSSMILKLQPKGKAAKSFADRGDESDEDLKDTSAGDQTTEANATSQTGNTKAKRQPKKARGEVKIENGELKVKVEGEWVSAIYLDEIRERILEETNAQGSYDHPPAKGKHALDVTAFHQDHKSWGESREHRPKVLFDFKKGGRTDPEDKVGIWIDNDKVVLGPDDVPIRDFQTIPKLCSSQMEGFRMEAITRLDPRICISDFRARMMKQAVPGANSLSMRKTRFRLRGRCLAWEQRAGSDFWESKLSAEMTDDMLEANSTELLQDLSSAEIEQLQLQTSGKNPERARGRALAENVRIQRLKAAKEKNAKKLALEGKVKGEVKDETEDSSDARPMGNHALVDKKRKRSDDLKSPDSEYVYESGIEEERASKKQKSSNNFVSAPTKRRRISVMGPRDSDDEYDDLYEEQSARKNGYAPSFKPPPYEPRTESSGLRPGSFDDGGHYERWVMERKRKALSNPDELEEGDYFDALTRDRAAKRRRTATSHDELRVDESTSLGMDNLTSQGPIQATAMASSMNDTSGSIPDALIDPALFQGTIIGADPSSSALQDMQDHYSQPFYDVAEDELRATLAQHRTRQVPQGGSSGHPSDNHVTAFRPSANTMTTLPVPNAPCASNLEDIPAEAELFGIDQFDAINGGPVYSFKQWLEIHGQHCYEQRVAEHGEMSWDDYCMSWAIMDSENPSRWSNPVSPENHQPELVPDFEDSFFADAARINGMSNEELLDSIRHPEVDMHSPYLPVEDTIPLQYLDNQRLSHDLGTSSLEHEFWP